MNSRQRACGAAEEGRTRGSPARCMFALEVGSATFFRRPFAGIHFSSTKSCLPDCHEHTHSGCSLPSLLSSPLSPYLPPSLALSLTLSLSRTHALLCAHMALEAPCSCCKSAQTCPDLEENHYQQSPGTLRMSDIPKPINEMKCGSSRARVCDHNYPKLDQPF